MKRILFTVICLTLCNCILAAACTECRPVVRAGVYDQDFAANLGLLLLPLFAILAIGAALYFSDSIMARLRKIKGENP